MVAPGRLSNKMVSLSKGASLINAASISAAVRVKESIGPVIEMSVVELVATDWEVVVIGMDTKLVIGVDTRAFFVPFNFVSTLVR